jgi:hypothetical protein
VDQFVPCLTRHLDGAELTAITLGDPLLDDYLAFVAARARTNTWLAVALDLKVFFGVVSKPPPEVSAADVFRFLSAQRSPRPIYTTWRHSPSVRATSHWPARLTSRGATSV